MSGTAALPEMRIVHQGLIGPSLSACERPMEGVVHVWEASLDVSEEERAHYASRLTSEEAERARRYRREESQRRFAVCRGMLRGLLSAYLGAPAEGITISLTEKGKPYLETPPSPALEFNVSHSEGRALFAVAVGRAVGADIERIRHDADLIPLTGHAMSPAERERWSRLPPEERTAAFFRVWTLKEAILKATGDGLGYPMTKVPAVLSDCGAVAPSFSFALEGRDGVAASLPDGDGYARAVCILICRVG